MNTILAGICTRRWRRISVAVFTFLVLGCMARADVVTDWNKECRNRHPQQQKSEGKLYRRGTSVRAHARRDI